MVEVTADIIKTKKASDWVPFLFLAYIFNKVLMDIDRVVNSKPLFATKKVGNDLVLVPIKNSVAEMDEMFTLNDVGRFIWESLVPGATIELLTEAIVTEFEIDSETAESDLNEFLSQLAALNNG